MSQGVYHVFNVAKMRIMEAVYRQYPKSVSVKEIAKVTGMEQNKVSRLLSHLDCCLIIIITTIDTSKG